MPNLITRYVAIVCAITIQCNGLWMEIKLYRNPQQYYFRVLKSNSLTFCHYVKSLNQISPKGFPISLPVYDQ